MSIGYDSAKVPDVTSRRRPARSPEFKGKVALNGDPTQAGAAFSGVMMAAIANGGSADDIAPGVDFFGELKKAGNFLPVDPTPATIESGQTPVVIDWDYLGAAAAANVDTWKMVVPEEAVVAGYYFQAINADAPHPAAARLWQEFLYSDEGQNLWLKGGARPVRGDAMAEAGTIDEALCDALPEVTGDPGDPDRRADDKARRSTWPTTGPRSSADARRTAQVARGPAESPSARSLPLLPVPRLLVVFLIVPTVTVIVGAFQGEDGGFTLGNIGPSLPAARRARGRILLVGAAPLIGARARRGARLPHRLARPEQHPPPYDAVGLRRARPVRRRHARLRLHRAVRLLRRAHRGAAGLARDRHLRLRLALRAARADRRLHLLPDPPDGHRLHAGPRGAPSPVARGRGEPRRQHLQYWRLVGRPAAHARPSSARVLLLFANAFAAYATAAVLVSQGNPIMPLLIRSALTSEVLLGQENLGFALALEMIVVVAVVMGVYALLLRRTSRWLR